ncbi:MAG: hypothetical protein AAFQ42_05780 [Pseudomonadota bacterium]
MAETLPQTEASRSHPSDGPELRAAPPGMIEDTFIGWQCRIRQIAMRQDAGRPSEGMAPRVTSGNGEVLHARMVVLIVPRTPMESTAYFKHQVRKSNDRREVLEKGLTYLQSTHFQVRTGFSTEMTALFAPQSPAATDLAARREVWLDFAQFGQAYRLPCLTRILDVREDAYAATLWHNRLFNPHLPDGATIIGLTPDWERGLMGGPG